MDETTQAEGWYLDPFKLHTDRWFSNGEPTKLVRDDGKESYDPPPSRRFEGQLTESPKKAPRPGEGAIRAGGDTEPDPSKGLWEQGLSMWSDYYEAGKRAGEK
jgi:hypothetical protein